MSATLAFAVSDPVAVGVKATVIVQDAPTSRFAPQVLVWLNELAFVPVMVTPFRLIGAVPEFLSVIAWPAEVAPTSVPVKVRVAGVRVAAGAVPVPVSAIVCGDPVALSAMLILAVSDPVAAGEKLTVIAQLPLAATVVPQLLVCENALALVPAIVIAEVPRVSGAAPVLVSVTACV